MRFSQSGAPNCAETPAQVRAQSCESLCLARLLLPAICFALFALPAWPQDNGSENKEFHGSGVEITVTVHSGSGEVISSLAVVKLLRDGTVPSGQAETFRGSAVLVVNRLGHFTVTVDAPGYTESQKDVSLDTNGHAQIDVYLQPTGASGSASGVPGKPLLAPKAQKALDKGLQAITDNKIGDAEKYVGEAIRLAPSNPDVLYVQGVLYLKQRQWTQAQTTLEKATQIDPSHARALAALGMALFDQGKFADAVVPLDKSLELAPANAWETRWTLARTYYQGAQYDAALKSSQDALADSNGKAPEIALLVAQSLVAVGRYEDAAQLLREFLKDHGNMHEAALARRWLDGLATNGKIQSGRK